jgi:hypothetical protein
LNQRALQVARFKDGVGFIISKSCFTLRTALVPPAEIGVDRRTLFDLAVRGTAGK